MLVNSVIYSFLCCLIFKLNITHIPLYLYLTNLISNDFLIFNKVIIKGFKLLGTIRDTEISQFELF